MASSARLPAGPFGLLIGLGFLLLFPEPLPGDDREVGLDHWPREFFLDIDRAAILPPEEMILEDRVVPLLIPGTLAVIVLAEQLLDLPWAKILIWSVAMISEI